MLNKMLLGSAAVVMTVAGAQAADLPSKKAAPATYVKICDAYGAGFFYIPGTDTCVKVGGYVRVDYDYRPERKNTSNTNGASGAYVNASAGGASGVSTGYSLPATSGYAWLGASGVYTPNGNTPVTDTTTSGFYNRGTVQLDARTPTSMGVARTFMALRLETGSGPQAKSSTSASLEAAYIQWAGFTAGQGAQPFAYMSSWAYNTHYWGGWPNGVRQLTYTAVLGGGFSATAGITDMHNYNAVATPAKDTSNAAVWAGTAEGLDTPGYNGIVYVGNVRYDQSWGNVQVMGAAHTGGNLSQDKVSGAATADSSTGVKKSGYAVGVGATFKLPMLAAGDEIQMTAVYADRLANLLADSGINTPSASAYGSNPIGGPATKFQDATGWVVGAQLRHYWTANFRSQVYAAYTSREQHYDTIVSGSVANNNAVYAKGTGTAYSLGKAFIYSPAKDFDIGLEFNYIRASWDLAAVKTVTAFKAATSGMNENNLVTKLRIQRNF